MQPGAWGGNSTSEISSSGEKPRQTPTTEWLAGHVKEARKCLEHWNVAISAGEGNKATISQPALMRVIKLYWPTSVQVLLMTGSECITNHENLKISTWPIMFEHVRTQFAGFENCGIPALETLLNKVIPQTLPRSLHTARRVWGLD